MVDAQWVPEGYKDGSLMKVLMEKKKKVIPHKTIKLSEWWFAERDLEGIDAPSSSYMFSEFVSLYKR